MSWNYRILRHGDGSLAIHEVFYDDDKATPHSCTVDPVAVVSDDLDGLERDTYRDQGLDLAARELEVSAERLDSGHARDVVLGVRLRILAHRKIDRLARGIPFAPAHMAPTTRETVVWADDASPFTGPQVKALLDENQRFRDALEKIEGGEGCYTRSYADCCDMHCATIARRALAVPPFREESTKGSKET